MKKIILLFTVFSIAFNAQAQIDIRLNSKISVSNSTYQTPITISCKVSNKGINDFVGDFMAAVYAPDSTTFLFSVDVKSGVSINAGGETNLQFYSDGLDSLIPTQHFVKIMFQTQGIIWEEVSSTPNYKNFEYLYIWPEQGGLFLYTEIQSNFGGLYQGIESSFTFNVMNGSKDTFKGDLRMSLYDLKGAHIETISSVQYNQGMPSGTIFGGSGVTMPTAIVKSNPGKYFLVLEYRFEGKDWKFIHGDIFTMCYLVFVEPTPVEDQYEPNNSIATAYEFPVNFVGDSAKIKAEDANYHKINDADYYKLTMPLDNKTGYKFIPKVYDVRNHYPNYTSYIALFYSLDGGKNWSADISMQANPVHVDAGMTVLFSVAKRTYNLGNYAFFVDVIKENTSSIKNISSANINLYPNPTNGIVNIDINQFNNNVQKIELVDLQGKVIMAINDINTENKISLEGISDGIYLVNIHTDQTILTEKLILKK